MFLPAPTLDDTRWTELVEEGRALIPLYAPEWTDHNLSDPGVTFAELFAWLAEMQVFQVDQVPERHRRKFLALVGIEPEAPRPAQTVVRFALPAGAAPVALPATVECEGRDPAADLVRVRTLRALRVVPAAVEAIVVRTEARTQDVTARWRRGEGFAAFGDDPQPGATLELALDAPLPVGETATIALTCAGARGGAAERARLLEIAALAGRACRPPDALVCCDDSGPAEADGAAHGPAPRPVHHSARVAWEILVAGGRWPAAGEVIDDTRSLTLDGPIDVAVGEAMAPRDGDGRYVLRCRFASGAYDEAPVLRDVALERRGRRAGRARGGELAPGEGRGRRRDPAAGHGPATRHRARPGRRDQPPRRDRRRGARGARARVRRTARRRPHGAHRRGARGRPRHRRAGSGGRAPPPRRSTRAACGCGPARGRAGGAGRCAPTSTPPARPTRTPSSTRRPPWCASATAHTGWRPPRAT